MIAPVDDSALAWGIKVSESHSAIAKSQAMNSFIEKEAFSYMASTAEEMARRFKQQVQAQREQIDKIHTQQESTNGLKQMLSQLLEDKKKKAKAKALSKKSKDKRKEGESSSSPHTKEEEHSNSELSKPSSEEEDNSEKRAPIPKE